MELKRKASMQSFYSSSVSSTTFTSFPPHPDDSSLWPKVTQVLQMSRKEEKGWWKWKMAVSTETGYENVFVVALNSKKKIPMLYVSEIEIPIYISIDSMLCWHIYQLFIHLNKLFSWKEQDIVRGVSNIVVWRRIDGGRWIESLFIAVPDYLKNWFILMQNCTLIWLKIVPFHIYCIDFCWWSLFYVPF